MKNRIIKVAAAGPKLKVGDVAYNSEQIIEMIKGQSDCGIIVFPELSLTGYTCADLFLSDLLLKRSEEALLKIAEETTNSPSLILVGVPIRFENSLYNCAAVISGGSVKAIVPKSFIPNYSEFYEFRWFASGQSIKGKAVRINGTEVPFGTDILVEVPLTEAVLGIEIC